MDLTDAIKEAYEYAPADTVYYETFQIDNDNLAASILLVNSYKSISRTAGTFLPCRFEAKLPDITGGSRGELTINLIGVTKEVRAAIRNANAYHDPFTLTYRLYINDSNTPDATLPVSLTIASISELFNGIQIQALMPDLVGAYFPRKLMTTKALPGLRT